MNLESYVAVVSVILRKKSENVVVLFNVFVSNIKVDELACCCHG